MGLSNILPNNPIIYVQVLIIEVNTVPGMTDTFDCLDSSGNDEFPDSNDAVFKYQVRLRKTFCWKHGIQI